MYICGSPGSSDKLFFYGTGGPHDSCMQASWKPSHLPTISMNRGLSSPLSVRLLYIMELELKASPAPTTRTMLRTNITSSLGV